MATAYQKRMMMRKNSDLTKLAEQYSKNIQAMTGQYESEFAKYQQERDAAMAPYEAAVKRYREVDMPAYESAAEAYKQQLEQYNRAIADYEANPTQRIQNQKVYGGHVQAMQIEGKTYRLNELPGDISIQYEGGKPVAYRDRPMPKAPSGAPSAPQAPTAPQIAGFDESKFQQKREQLQTEFKRETGERKGARLAAVSRKGSRPLMQEK